MGAAVNEFLAKPGLIDTQLGRAFSLELNRRIVADYEEGGVDAAAATHAIENAKAFNSAIRVLIDSHGPEA